MSEGRLFIVMRVVLLEPEIPQNTGNVGRLCSACGLELVLAGRLGFSLDDKYLKRAGMDYWNRLSLRRYDTVEEYLDTNPVFFALSTKGRRLYSEIKGDPRGDSFDLVFGCEGSGLPLFVYEKYADRLYRIPMIGNARSLNLASSVAVAVYSVLEKSGFPGFS